MARSAATAISEKRRTIKMKIEVNQIYYKEEQKVELLHKFRPYNNIDVPPPHNFEYSVIISYYLSGKISADLTGFVSWKFNQKTYIDDDTFLNFIRKNPGKDVYFINPFPDQVRFKNVWIQGEKFHPELINLTSDILRKSGYKIDLRSFENKFDTLCYCNYWV